jgi:hypothetical protein
MNMRSIVRAIAVCFALAALLLPLSPAFADDPIAEVILKSDSILFQPQIEAESFVLTVNSPCGIVIRQEFDGSDTPTFALEALQVENVDGTYRYRLEQTPFLSGAQRELIADLRKNGDANDVARSQTDGLLPKGAPDQSGYFVVSKGAIITDTGAPEEGKRVATEPSTPDGLRFGSAVDDSPGASGGLRPTVDKQTISGDLTVYNSLCVGFDCLANETYGSDTIRLKENNLRIHFDDTSVGSFPANDWRIIANSNANGGGSYFSVEDSSAGRRVFTVEASAPSNSLYVDNGGRVGIRTSNPVVDLHISDGDTPTVRLEQNGASGFAPQTWDLAGNETSFFIRDASNGSTLPFRIRPGADSNSLVIDTDNDVGIGLLSPDAALHVRGSDGDTQLHVEETSGTVAARNMMVLENNGGVRFSLERSDTGGIWQITALANFNINDPSDGNTEFQLTAGGDLTIEGDYFSTTCTAGNPCAPDYVFEPDYDLLSLEQVRNFVAENKHLPNVPSAEELTGPINISKMQMKLLEKIEELTLYTLDQDAQLADLQRLESENAALKTRLDSLEARLEALTQ